MKYEQTIPFKDGREHRWKTKTTPNNPWRTDWADRQFVLGWYFEDALIRFNLLFSNCQQPRPKGPNGYALMASILVA